MEQEKNNNKGVIALLIVIIVILLALVVLFATGTISFKSNELNNNQQTTENGQTNTNNGDEPIAIQTKLVDNLLCNNSETTFNGITVKLEQEEEDMMCTTNSIAINNKNIKSDIQTYVKSYEIYDNNVIIFSGNTSGTLLSIYSLANNSTIMKLGPESLGGYKVISYYTDNNKIIINGEECGEQCGTGTTGYTKATFEIEYLNNNFSSPKLVSHSNE